MIGIPAHDAYQYYISIVFRVHIHKIIDLASSTILEKMLWVLLDISE